MLSIIVPHHDETIDLMDPLFRSIDMQVGINFDDLEIILCRDVEKSPIDDYDFKDYKHIANRIIRLKSDRTGLPGVSRQVGLDHAKGEYVIFCDADDCLFHVGVLREILENIKNTHADVYRYKFIEEIGSFTSDDKVYQMKDYNWVWVFSKVYRKDFLTEHNLRFHDNLRWHEDNYLNTLCAYCNPKTVDVNSTPMYLWRFNPKSITRVNNHEYSFNSIDELLLARGLAYEKIITEYKKDCTADILNVIVREYLNLIDPKYQGCKNYAVVEKAFYDFVVKFMPALVGNNYSPEIENFIVNVYKAAGANFIPSISMHDYLIKLQQKFNKGIKKK